MSTEEIQRAGFDGSRDGGKWVTLGDPCSMGILSRSEGEYRGQRLGWESDETRYGTCSVLNIYMALGKSLYIFSLPFMCQLHSHGTTFPRCGTTGLKVGLPAKTQGT